MEPPPTHRLPMFPLGTVLFPFALLPLHIFEPRFLQMVDECLAGDREFGVTLIERGSEVGGGDQRTRLGTRARILQTAELPGGRRALVAAGLRRIEVVEWLDDDPYPQAMVVDLHDHPTAPDTDRLIGMERTLRRVLSLHSELGLDVGDLSFALDGDPTTATFQACALAPLGPFDAQRLLAADDAESRLDRLEQMLAEQADLLEQRLGDG